MSKIKKVALGEVCDVRDGTHDSPKYVNEGYPFITSKNIKNGRIDFSDIKYITKEDFDKINQRSYVDNGDIIMPMIGTIGNPVVVNKDREFAIKNVTLIKFNKNSEIYNKFLQNYLSYYFNRNINYEAGSTLKFISLSEIRNILIPLPPLPIQQQIAARLEKADELRRMRRYAIEMSERFLQEVFIEMFGDPVKNPKGWDVVELINCLEEDPQNGLYMHNSFYGRGTKILRIDSFYNGYIENINDLKLIDIDSQIIKTYKLEERNIVINRVNSLKFLGKSAIVPKTNFPVVFESNMMRIKVKQDILNPNFLISMLQQNNIRKQILTCAKNAVNQASINQEDVKSFKFPLPNMDIQLKYEKIKISHESLIWEQREALRQSELLFSSLLNEAFSE